MITERKRERVGEKCEKEKKRMIYALKQSQKKKKTRTAIAVIITV
jgi:hypothetical protein